MAVRGGKRAFAAGISEKSPVSAEAIRKGVPRPLDRIDIVICGEVSLEGEAVWFKARTSGTRIRLGNPTGAGETPAPDLLAELRGHVKEGRTRFEVSGELRETEGGDVLLLTRLHQLAEKK